MGGQSLTVCFVFDANTYTEALVVCLFVYVRQSKNNNDVPQINDNIIEHRFTVQYNGIAVCVALNLLHIRCSVN